MGKWVERAVPALVGLGLLALGSVLNARFEAGAPLFRTVPPYLVIFLCSGITLTTILVWLLARLTSRESR